MTTTLTQTTSPPPKPVNPTPAKPVAAAATPLKPLLPASPAKIKLKPRRPVITQTKIRFSPTAWAKLLFFRDRGPTEIGGFGITPADDLLYIQDFVTVRQFATSASISFDDDAVADFFDGQVDAGLKPVQFGRVWCHTHPGSSPNPSSTDEETFDRVFGGCQHAVMFIMAQGGQCYARLRFNVGPGGDVVLPVGVSYARSFVATDRPSWAAEYKANIFPEMSVYGLQGGQDDWFLAGRSQSGRTFEAGDNIPHDWLEELEHMEPAERRAIMEELGSGDPWEGGFYG